MLKDKIFELRKEGKSYNQISKILGCAKSTVSHHCSKGGNSRLYIEGIDHSIQDRVINLRISKMKFNDIYNLLNGDVTRESLKLICRKNGLSFNSRLSEKDGSEIKRLYMELKSIKAVVRETGFSFLAVRRFIDDPIRKPPISRSQSVVSWRKRKKIELVEYKGGCCQVCGYDKSVRALEFHHIDPNEKDFTISGKSWSFERLKNEVDKCVLVCANCHIEIHEGLVKLN